MSQWPMKTNLAKIEMSITDMSNTDVSKLKIYLYDAPM